MSVAKQLQFNSATEKFISVGKQGKYWKVEVDLLLAPNASEVTPEGARRATSEALKHGCISAFGIYKSRYTSRPSGKHKGSTFEEKILNYGWEVIGWWKFKDENSAISFANAVEINLPQFMRDRYRSES